MAKRMGAQLMGLGAFTKVVGDAGVTVAKKADIPITTGNSYSASGALWAAADVVRRMGLIKIDKGQRIQAKTMVLGATGAIGSVCCRLLAKAFGEVYLVGRNTAKLLAMKESIHKEDPDVQLTVTTRPDKYLADMDVIVAAALLHDVIVYPKHHPRSKHEHEESAVKAKITQMIGETLSQEKTNEDIKNIFKMGYFDDVGVAGG